jgi:hypothetical protein
MTAVIVCDTYDAMLSHKFHERKKTLLAAPHSMRNLKNGDLLGFRDGHKYADIQSVIHRPQLKNLTSHNF